MKLSCDFTELTAVVAKMHGVTLEEMQKRLDHDNGLVDLDTKIKEMENNVSSMRTERSRLHGEILTEERKIHRTKQLLNESIVKELTEAGFPT